MLFSSNVVFSTKSNSDPQDLWRHLETLQVIVTGGGKGAADI